jgi:hypothetical protein
MKAIKQKFKELIVQLMGKIEFIKQLTIQIYSIKLFMRNKI